MRSLAVALCVGGAVLLASGCGGGKSDDPSAVAGEDGVVGVSEQYFKGLAEGDGAKACSVLDAPSQQALIQLHSAGGNCLDAVKAAAQSLSAEQKADLTKVKVDVAEAGDESGRARVKLAADTAAIAGVGDGSYSLVRPEQHWELTLPIAKP